jgi:phenylacetate-CoA ligase
MRTAEANLDRAHLAALQEELLGRMLDEVLPRNPFYTRKLAVAGIRREDVLGLHDLALLPFTTKAELLADQETHPPYGTNLTYSLTNYRRLHQTSATTGRPLRWLDTADSWDNLLGCWDTIYDFAGIAAADRLFFAFSFGPFLGFWTAFEAASRRGCLCLAAGGMSSGARLRMLLDNEAQVVLCTPTYALRLAEVAQEQGVSLGPQTPGYRVRSLIVAGEPGGSIPATRGRIEEAWHARVFDHSGSTECGPMTIECQENPGGLHVLEADYVIEVIDPRTSAGVEAGQVGELVVTTLKRTGSPLLRYRTGDLVRIDPDPCPCGRSFRRLAGGILGRTDDMIYLRGNNFYPSALEDVIRGFPEVSEYRVEIDHSGAMAALRVEIEATAPGKDAELADRVSQAIRARFLFRADVAAVPSGTLPRFEMKANRIHHKGKAGQENPTGAREKS